MAAIIFLVILSGCCAYALLFGGSPERKVALMLFGAAAATAIVGYGFPQPAGSLRWPVMLVDFVLVGCLTWVALTADRLWPMLATALQLISAIAHLALDLAGQTTPRAYVIAIFMSGFLIPPVLAFGTFFHRRRTAREMRSTF